MSNYFAALSPTILLFVISCLVLALSIVMIMVAIGLISFVYGLHSTKSNCKDAFDMEFFCSILGASVGCGFLLALHWGKK